ncbi:hypothetical protein WME99_50765 [Sorangium sp. So ce136]|uniref:hypothetical protein n=1 Tax=Sorangium sp. So ce136 TaxID=3133284 RepID=UPI003F086AFA
MSGLNTDRGEDTDIAAVEGTDDAVEGTDDAVEGTDDAVEGTDDAVGQDTDKAGSASRKPRGLLSLLYWVKNSDAINQKFHGDMLATMENIFGIPRTDPRAQAMLQISTVSTKPSEVKPLLEKLLKEHLVKELMSTKPQFW